MGAMLYAGVTLEFDDRLLTHLQIVIMQKFRRGEAFSMSWANDVSMGSGRGSLWLTPTMPVVFTFHGSRVPSVDQLWIDRLNESALSPRGLIVTTADGALVHPGQNSAQVRGGHATQRSR